MLHDIVPRMIPTADSAPFANLSPDLIVDAVEAAGFPSDGRILALGSYENRVFQVGLEDAEPVVVKFYRPGRWTDAAIAEEHAFARELAAAEIPVVAPLEPLRRDELGDGPGAGFWRLPARHLSAARRAVAGTRNRGRPAVDRALPRANSRWSARARAFDHRARLSPTAMGRDSVDVLLEQDELIPDYIRASLFRE